jgi:uncharacterized protein (DUF736 family)
MEKKQSVGAAWIKTGKSGKQFISLSIGDKKYTLFANDYKKEPKHPDYKVFEDTWVAKNQGQFETMNPVANVPSPDDTDLPF